MLIKQPPMETNTTRHICDYHKRNPGKNYAGCTCSGSITIHVKPVEDWTMDEIRHYCGEVIDE